MVHLPYAVGNFDCNKFVSIYPNVKEMSVKNVTCHNSESWANRKIVHMWGKTTLRFSFHIWL
jgi:hypothetical protein